MAINPGRQQADDQFVDIQERNSIEVQQQYFEEAAVHYRRMAEHFENVAHDTSRGRTSHREMPKPRKSWISDPMMVMLCRKDPAGPSIIVHHPQEYEPMSQHQHPEYQQGEENWAMDGFVGAGEFEGAAGHGGLLDVNYASMPGRYGHGVFGHRNVGPSQYLSVPRIDGGYGNLPEEDYED